MARHKNTNWTLPETMTQWIEVNTALLMDIRDELQRLNNTMNCYRVHQGMDALHNIDRRLKANGFLLNPKPKRLAKKAAK